MTATILDRIAEKRRERIAAEMSALPFESVREAAKARPPTLNALDRLRRWPEGSRAIISEIKRRSPSRGELAPGLDPARLSKAYEEGGAFAISCLVEPDFFGGGLADLDAVRKSVAIPVLYKDFVVHPYQLWQARAHGADMILLIAALLGETLGDYHTEAEEAGLVPLVEIHDEEELGLAVNAGARLLGVNNRNLKTFAVDLAVSERLIPLMPPGTLAVAESGISTAEEMDRLAKAGARAFLIGETFVRAEDPGAALRRLAHGSNP